MTVYRYEIELRATNPNTGVSRLVTRTEHAYGIQDAWMQAVLNHIAANPGEEPKLVRIGPPADVIAASALDIDQRVAAAMRSVLRDDVGGIRDEIRKAAR